MFIPRDLLEIWRTARAPLPKAKAGNKTAIRDARYHRRIVIVGTCFGAVSSALTTIVTVRFLIPSLFTISGIFRLWAAILGSAIIGFTFGLAVMVLFAPTGFLSGKVGRRWLKLAGTDSPTTARTLCAVIILIPSFIALHFLKVVLYGFG